MLSLHSRVPLRLLSSQVHPGRAPATVAETSAYVAALTARIVRARALLDKRNWAERMNELKVAQEDPQFWTQQRNAQALAQEYGFLSDVFTALNEASSSLTALDSLLADLHASSTTTATDLSHETAALHAEAHDVEISTLTPLEESLRFPRTSLDGRATGAAIHVQPGAGGDDAADWAAMLVRMYRGWAESPLYRVEQRGERELRVWGRTDRSFAYGWLRRESGVHRLVRISPFDQQKRRHTAFAAVTVLPLTADSGHEISPAIDIDENDLRIETFRSSGAGGQHVNTTDSGVRVTHVPTGVVVRCQQERSQHRNREVAVALLREKLRERRDRERAEGKAAFASQLGDISWGRHLRSYVLHPYQLVKDHRTGVQSHNVDGVLRGDIAEFLEAAVDAALDSVTDFFDADDAKEESDSTS